MFASFAAGTVHHPSTGRLGSVVPADSIAIRYPTRLNAMALQPGAIAGDHNLIYDAGELVFSIGRFHRVRVRRLPVGSGLVLAPGTARPLLVKHAARIVCAAIDVPADLFLTTDSDPLPVHTGFGSSSSLIAAVATAVNHLFGSPIDRADLISYLTSNHGEEHGSEPGMLMPVQCIGGSAASGLYPGGVQIVSGRSTVVLTAPVPAGLSFVLAWPRAVRERSTEDLMAAEIEQFDRFRETGEKWAPTIAFRMLHEAMPGLVRGDLGPLGALVFDYRFRMGSIENCSFSYPGLSELAAELEPLKSSGQALVLGLSSVGPAFFALTEDPAGCETFFAGQGLNTLRAQPHNGTYELMEFEQ